MNTLNVKKNDSVLIIAGNDKGKTGKVLATSPKTGRVIVEGINVQIKHKKARSAQEAGGRIEKAGAIDVSNVMVICPTCGKATRIAYGKDDAGKSVRICKKCGVALNKKEAKEVKKETKKTTKTTKTTKTSKKKDAKVEE